MPIGGQFCEFIFCYDELSPKQNRESTEGYSNSIVGKITTGSGKRLWSRQVIKIRK